MQIIHQLPEQPFTYIVENGYGKVLGTVDEIHRNDKVSYNGTRFTGLGAPLLEQKELFSGFTAALQYVGGN